MIEEHKNNPNWKQPREQKIEVTESPKLPKSVMMEILPNHEAF